MGEDECESDAESESRCPSAVSAADRGFRRARFYIRLGGSDFF